MAVPFNADSKNLSQPACSMRTIISLALFVAIFMPNKYDHSKEFETGPKRILIVGNVPSCTSGLTILTHLYMFSLVPSISNLFERVYVSEVGRQTHQDVHLQYKLNYH